MKRFKNALSILLAAALLLSALSIPVTAAQVYPESEHNYQNNTDEIWTYTYPEETDGLYVTFSEETRFSTGYSHNNYLTEEELEGLDEYQLENFIRYGYIWSWSYDMLYVYYGDNELYGVYSGSELAGVTLYIPGNSFTLELVTDGEDTAYGFSITNISSEVPENRAIVNYHLDDNVYPLVVNDGETITLNPYYCLKQYVDKMLIGWRTSDGRAWNYNVSDWGYEDTCTSISARSGETYDLYPVYTVIGMRAEEVYSFTNSDSVFSGGYYYTDGHFYRNIANWAGTYTLTPFMPVAAVGVAFFTAYWPTFDFEGSCCGFPVTEILQHYGKIDLLSRQGVNSVSELEPDDELTSLINVYNNNCVACHLVNNVAIEPGTEAYTEQLKKLYSEAEAGTPIYFEFYPYSEHPMKAIAQGNAVDIFDGAHGILITGAYTSENGQHVLIACDCNSTSYVNGGCDTVIINEDFTEIEYWGNTLNGFSWNDDMSQFDSFKLEGVSNPFSWHIAFFCHLIDTLKQLLALFGIKLPF